MELKEPEINHTIQNASQRIYYEMLKNTENSSENENFGNCKLIQNEILNNESHEQLNHGRDLRDVSLSEQRVEISLSDFSDCNSILELKFHKPPRPPLPMHSYKTNKENELSQKNAICNQDLSEGEAVASKLKDYRLIKGISKSVGNNLNIPYHSTQYTEYSVPTFPPESYPSNGEIITNTAQSTNGILYIYFQITMTNFVISIFHILKLNSIWISN